MRLASLPLCSLVLAACGGPSSLPPTDGGAADAAQVPRPPLGAPFQAPAGRWSWVDLAGAVCDDGSPTGIGVNGGSGPDLLFYFMGGGACWDNTTCFVANTATHGPIGAAQLNAAAKNLATNTVFDRDSPTNPFRDATYVLIPYCTGDLHVGDRLASYGGRPYHHKGRANVLAAAPRVAATWPNPRRLVVSGSSAGGYGAVFNYQTLRAYFPEARGYLVDDSGPPLRDNDIPPGFRDAWIAAWGLDGAFDSVCPTCRNDFSQVFPTIAARYPKDRLSLLSYNRDRTISGYIFVSPAGFQTALDSLAQGVLAPLANARHFYLDGQDHTMLGRIKSLSGGGVRLDEWLRRQVDDDGAWKSIQP